MACYDHKIEIPVQYVSMTFQVRSQRGRPAVSGKNAEVGDVEEEKHHCIFFLYQFHTFLYTPLTLNPKP